MIEVVERPTFTLEDFDCSRKKVGVSAIVRLRNEAEYLEAALNSIYGLFDELVIVYNRCADRTAEIVAEYARRDPHHVRAFHYVPTVYPPLSEMHRTLPPSHMSSFVHYSNFALSRASYRVCTKWDGDQVAVSKSLRPVIDSLRTLRRGSFSWWLSPWKMGYWWFSGVNLYERSGKIYVMKQHPISGSRKDIGFWPIGRRHTFRHHSSFEYLRTWWFMPSFAGFVYFHVKGLKRDRGLGTYLSEEGGDSIRRRRIERNWTEPELITFDEYQQVEPRIRNMPAPESLGIRPSGFQDHTSSEIRSS